MGSKYAGRDAICPVCGASIPATTLRLAKPFGCAACGSTLKTTQDYGVIVTLGAIAMAAAIAYLIGARGMILFAVVALGFFPIDIMLMGLVRNWLHVDLQAIDTTRR